jgi:hypothetical protein
VDADDFLVFRPDGHHAVEVGAGEGGVEGRFGLFGEVKIGLLMRRASRRTS